MRLLVQSITFATLIGSSLAQITYVDIDTGQNTIELVTASNTAWGTTTNNSGDGLWARRTNGPAAPANGGTAWQANHSEDAPTLFTTIAGLTPNGDYSVYVYMIGKQCSHWPIQAGFSLNRMYAIDDRDGIPVTPTGAQTTAPSCSDFRFQVFLGHQVANASGEIFVFFDDYTSATNPNPGTDRAVLDGVGVEPVLRAGVVPSGVGCPGSLGFAPRASSPNLPTLGNANWMLTTSDGLPNAIAGTFLDLSITQVTVNSCLVELVNAPAILHVLDASGSGSVVFPIPNNAQFLGLILYSQTVTIDPGAQLAGFLGLSRSLDIYVGN